MSYVRRAGLAVAGVAVLLIATLAGDGTDRPDPNTTRLAAGEAAGPTQLYLVQVDGEPLASYGGGVGGLPSTRGQSGGRPDKRAWGYRAYREFLGAKHTEVMRAAGISPDRAVTRYHTAFNGFAVPLSRTEYAKVRATRGVARVWPNEIRRVQTFTTPRFLGLSGADGVWRSAFGDPERAGAGVIVGVIDTGYWPEHPSLAALPSPRADDATINAKWFADGVDKCDEGKDEPVACNSKVIGARYYDATGLGGWDQEYASPRDYDGHGTHTATTAVGGHAVPAKINGDPVGTVSGVAPGARLAVYKALWRQPDGTGAGGTVDLVQAIDDAVADGVDVINYSVSGGTSTVVDPVELAFFHAAAAGVFVATSAGNDGPGASTVAHNAPWTTTVAASTHDRPANVTLTLGDGTRYEGAGQGPALAAASIVDASESGLAGADPVKLGLCFPDTLDPERVTGRIVLCQRGTNPRTDKSRAVREAGGVGMVLYNPTPNSQNADYHVIPTIHIGPTEGEAVKRYIATAAYPTARLSGVATATPRAPQVAAFSAAGPALAAGGDLLKPDLTGPGVDIVAGVSPSGHHGNLFDGLSGTSMSAPHVAGIAALVRAKYPTWSPAAVKSALMTTATLRDNQGRAIRRAEADATPLDLGAGHVSPAAALNPGLVYDAGVLDWIRYACGIGELQLVSDWCPNVEASDPSDFNSASIAIGDLAGSQRVDRTVTNVTGQAGVYMASIQAPRGVSVRVSPRVLTLGPGRSATFRVEFTRTSAAFGQWAYGALTWTDLRGHAVRSPLAVRPVALRAPAEVAGTGISGRATLDVQAGYGGEIRAEVSGLEPSTVVGALLRGTEPGFDASAPATGAGVHRFVATVPPGTRHARVSTFDDEHSAGSDLDLYVYRDGKLIGQSVGTSAEENVVLPEPGRYTVYVVQFATPSGVTQQRVRAHTFTIGWRAAGNLDVTPASRRAAVGQAVQFALAWHDLDSARRYLGEISYTDGTQVRGSTLVSVRP